MTIFEALPLCDDILNVMLDFNIGDTTYWKSIFTNVVLKYGFFNIEVIKENKNENLVEKTNYISIYGVVSKFKINNIYKIKFYIKKCIRDDMDVYNVEIEFICKNFKKILLINDNLYKVPFVSSRAGGEIIHIDGIKYFTTYINLY